MTLRPLSEICEEMRAVARGQRPPDAVPPVEVASLRRDVAQACKQRDEARRVYRLVNAKVSDRIITDNALREAANRALRAYQHDPGDACHAAFRAAWAKVQAADASMQPLYRERDDASAVVNAILVREAVLVERLKAVPKNSAQETEQETQNG